MATRKIIDISRHQGPVDFHRLRHEADVAEIIIRSTMGGTGVDDRYAENWREAAWAGIELRGIYHYVVTGVSASAQVANIFRVTGGDFGNRPLVLDCERTSYERERMALGWPFPRVAYTYTLLEMCELLKPYTDIHIYSNYYEWVTITTQPGWASEYGLHIAAYPNNPDDLFYKPRIPSPWTEWELWQYSATGRLPGIAGNVDLNRRRVVTDPVTDPTDLKRSRILGLASAILEELDAPAVI